MRKILFIVTQSEFGGAQRYIFELVKGLNAEKYDFLIAAGEGDGELFRKSLKLKTQSEKLQLKTQNLRYLKRAPWPWEMILAIKEIVNLLRKEKPDVLFLCSTTAGILGSIAGLFYKLFAAHCSLFIVYRIGGWAFNDPRPRWQNKIILRAEKLTAPLKDKVIVNSEFDRQLAIKYKICPAEKIIKIHNGIDINRLDFLSKEGARNYFILTNKLSRLNLDNISLIGTVANFYKTKGLEYLIEAADCLTPDVKQRVIFIVIGDGKQRPALESLIKKYKLENNFFLAGRISDAYKYLKGFDVFVLPSLKEGFPWIILEAMAAEVPIIATKVGALPEIIEDGKEGVLVEPKNSEVLAEKIFRILSRQKEAKEMTIAAKEKLKREFNLEKMIKTTEGLFHTQ